MCKMKSLFRILFSLLCGIIAIITLCLVIVTMVDRNVIIDLQRNGDSFGILYVEKDVTSNVSSTVVPSKDVTISEVYGTNSSISTVNYTQRNYMVVRNVPVVMKDLSDAAGDTLSDYLFNFPWKKLEKSLLPPKIS